MSGFEYAFVSEVPREYFCPICDCPMREPVQTKCGHRFCKHCLEQSMKRKRKCPIDRRALDEHSAKDIYPDVAIQRTILDFVVKCPNECNGCKWTGELRSIETHKSTCSFVGVKCTNTDCDATPLKKDLHNHVTNECTKRKVECLYCRKASFIWCTRQGHFDVCKKYPLECLQKCGEQIPRDKMNDHINKSCPYTKLECTYAHVGCKAKVQRRAISDHVKRNTESHLKLACERLQELPASSILTKASIKDEQTKMVTVMKKIKELSEGVIKSEALQVLLDNEIAAVNKKLPKLQSKDDATDRRLSALQADAVTIKKEMSDHIDKSCPHTTVECTYACVGCKVKVQRRAIADHVKRNTESHLMLACERLKELQVSLTLTTASIKHEIVTATKKINELSEAVLNSGDLQELRNKVTTTLLSSLTAVVDTIKTKMEELTENMSSNDETLSELEDEVNELQELIPRVDSLQGLREEVWRVNTNLKKLKEAITRFEKTNSSRNRQVLCEIDDAKWQLRS